jgi:hypothetical protein
MEVYRDAFYAYPSSWIADHNGGHGWYWHLLDHTYSSDKKHNGPFPSLAAAVAASRFKYPLIPISTGTAMLVDRQDQPVV